MKFKKVWKGFIAFVLVLALSVAGMTLALASDQDAEDVEAEEDVKTVDTTAFKAVVVDPEDVSETEVPEEEVSEPAAVEPESETAPSEADSSDKASNEASASESKSEPAAVASETKSESAAAETVLEPEAEETPAVEAEETEETVESDVSEPEEEVVETEEITGVIIEDAEPVEMVSAEELLASGKEGIYVALRNAGMSHVGAASVMAVMDATSEFEVSDGGLFGWTDEWKAELEEYAGDNVSSYAYQIAFLLETIENPEEEGTFDILKSALMSDDSYILTDVWYFLHYYSDKVNPENEIDINDCLRLAREYVEEFDSIKDTYESLPSVFDMSESTSGQAVVEYACNFIGNPYVWGGTSLTNGADCSGFIQSVYAHFGVSLPHYSGALRSVGYEVSPAEMLPGDIICYSGHCAIYIGNGQIVHASNSKPYPAGGIKISSNYNYRTVLAIRRVVEPDVVTSGAIDIEPVVLTEPEVEEA